MAPRPKIACFGLMQVANWPIFMPGLIQVVLVDPKLLLFGPCLARMVLVDPKLPFCNPRLRRMGLGDHKLLIFDCWLIK